MRVGVLLCFLAVWPAALIAGPWPREKGTGFLSLTTELWQSNIPEIPHYFASTFVEYGLTDRLTLGGKYAMGSEAGTSMDLRLGISLVRERPYALSLEMVVGERDSERFLLVQPAVPPPKATASFGTIGLAYGRGLTFGERPGWLAVEGAVTTPLEDRVSALGLSGPAWQLDTTLGLNFDNGWMAMTQVFAVRDDAGRSLVKIAPGVVIPVGETSHIELSVRVLTHEIEASALAFGLWRNF